MLLSSDRVLSSFFFFFLGMLPFMKGQNNSVVNNTEPTTIPILIPDYNTDKALLKTVDLKPFCPSPKDQQNTGACVSFALGYGAMSIMQAIKYQWKSPQLITQNAFSSSFIYNQIATETTCLRGIIVEKALQLLKDKGNCREAVFSFTKDCALQPPEAAMLDAKQFKIQTVDKIFAKKAIPQEKIQLLKQYLQDSIPIIVNFQNFKCFQETNKGVQFWAKKSTAYLGQHTMVVVGMDEEKQAFEVMNSWGTDWANNGFVKIDYEEFSKYCLDAFTIMPTFSSTPVEIPTMMVAQKNISDKLDYPIDKDAKPPFSIVYSIKDKGHIEVIDAIPSMNGDLLMVVSKTTASDKKNVYIYRVNQKGKVVGRQKIGNSKDYDVVGIAEDHLGKIILVGNTPGEEGQDNTPWLLRCTKEGLKIDEKKAIRNDDFSGEAFVKQVCFNKITNQIFCFVSRANKILLVQKYTMDGTLIDGEQISQGRFAELKILPKDPFKVLALKGNYFIYCTAKRGRNKKLPLLIKLKNNGEYIGHVSFPDRHIDATGGITALSNGDLGMTGTIYDQKQETKEDIFYWNVKNNLEKGKGTKLFKTITFDQNSSGLDEGIDLVAINAQIVWLVGNTKSHTRGAHKKNLILFVTNKDGLTQEEEPFFWGENLTEQVKKMILMPNNHIWVIGKQDEPKGIKTKSNLFIGVIPTVSKSVRINPNAFNVSAELFGKFSNNNNGLTPSNEGFIKVKLDNKSNLELIDLKVKVEIKSPTTTRFVYEEVWSPKIFPGSANYIAMPFEWTNSTEEDFKKSIVISVLDNSGQVIKRVPL